MLSSYRVVGLSGCLVVELSGLTTKRHPACPVAKRKRGAEAKDLINKIRREKSCHVVGVSGCRGVGLRPPA